MKNKQKLLLVLAIILAACCLRSPLTGVGPLVGMIQADLQIEGGAAGMLTTIPLLAFAALSLFVGKFSQKIGAGNAMLASMAVLLAGILCRSFAGTTGLFLGTVLVGIGIAVGNVLLPAIIKAYFPNQVGIMTSAYTTAMSIFAGISGGVSVPIAMKYGWQTALLVWGALVLVACLCWLPNRSCTLLQGGKRKLSAIVHSSMTWWIAFYMGTQSFLFYCLVAWFATILQTKGFSAETAGYFHSIYLLLGIPGSFIVPILAGRQKNQSMLGIGLGVIYTVGIAALLLAKGLPLLLLALLCCGFCSGASISFAMTLFGLHTSNAADASSLSGLAQSVGYLFAAVGPALIGKLYDGTGAWTVPLVVLLGLALFWTVLGYLVGREKIINEG